MQFIYTVQNRYNIRKRIVLTAIALLILSAIVLIVIPVTSLAFQYEEYVKALKDAIDPNTLGNFVQNAANTMFGSYMDMASEDGVAGKGLLVTTSLAASLFGVYIVITIIREALNGKANLDMFTKVFIKMAVTFFVLINLNPLTAALHNVLGYFINVFINGLNTAVEGHTMTIYNEYSQALTDTIQQGDSFNQFSVVILAMFIARIIMALPKFIVTLMILLDSYALVIELFLRKIFMPLATLSFLDDSSSRMGVRYIKRFVGVYLKMLIYITSLVIAELIASAGLVNTDLTIGEKADMFSAIYVVGGYLLSYCALIFAAVTFSRKSETLTDEILGV